LRYDEDYSVLKNDTLKTYYYRAKFSPLNKSRRTYVSFGGDVRFQYLYSKNEDWGSVPEDKDGSVLSRFLAHADFHAGEYFRSYIELQSSMANGTEDPPPPVLQNELDLHQAFADIDHPLRKQRHLILRVGRQEMLYGTQRLVSVKEGLNNRQSFDAVKLMYGDTTMRVDAFFSEPVRPVYGIFNDKVNKHAKFWGSYVVVNDIPILQNVDLYYLGLSKSESMFDDGTGKELRHSVGTRIWMNSARWYYDFEGLYQWGKFGPGRISAWTVSSNSTYIFRALKRNPQINLKAEIISGDKNYQDEKLNTFNPLFPRGAYFGLASLIGPSNLVDLHPAFIIDVSDAFLYEVDYDAFWRFSVHDGVYGPSALLLYSGKTSEHKFIGSQLATYFIYNPNRFFNLQVELTWFKAGQYLKDVGPGKNILFTAVTAQCIF
jgi:hypothetical protein